MKELDIAIVKATNHVEYPPKERHVRSMLTYDMIYIYISLIIPNSQFLLNVNNTHTFLINIMCHHETCFM